jgi:Ser/Thr protein kinase RdoA (MazF antagonist)
VTEAAQPGLLGRVGESQRGRVSPEDLGRHLGERHGIAIRAVNRLEPHGGSVFRIDRADGPPWVARVFHADRPLAEVEGDARILRALERRGFPAERCATSDPTSSIAGCGVLVTLFINGDRPAGRARTFAMLGGLLGALHASSADGSTPMRSGGGWHHLVAQGTPADEIDAALKLVAELRERMGESERPHLGALRHALFSADDCDGLPEALLHPDFVPANALGGPDGGLVMVDWTGAGRGPRLWPLAFLLWAAGAHDIQLVDAVASRYAKHVRPTEAELARLAAAVRARPLVLASWKLAAGRGAPADVMEELDWVRRLSAAIAVRATDVFRALAPPPAED